MDDTGLIRTLVAVAEAPVDPPSDFHESLWETLQSELTVDAQAPVGFGEAPPVDESRPGLVPQTPHQRSRRPGGVWVAVAMFSLIVAVGLAVWAIRPQEPGGEITDSPPLTVPADDDPDIVTEGEASESGVWSHAQTTLGRDEFSPRVFVIDDRVLVIHEQNRGTTVAGEIYDPVVNEARPIADSGLVWRANAAMVWTGTELLIVGGSNGPGIDQIGAAYDPASDTWRPLPDPPGDVDGWDNSLTGTAAWTGSEMLIPARGLAFDPVTDQWRTFTPQPGPQRNAPVTAWTGTEVLVWGGCDTAIPQCDDFQEGLLTDGYAYTPATDAWRPLAPSPLATGVHPAGEWTRTGLLIFAGTGHPDDGVTFARYDPYRDRWQELAEPPLAPRRYAASAWTGRSFVLWGGSAEPEREFSDGATYDVESDTWESLPPAPNSAARDRHAMTWVAGRLYITGGHRTLGPLVFTPGETLESSTSTAPETSLQTTDIEPLLLEDGASLIEVAMEDGTRFAVLMPTPLVPEPVAVTTGMSNAEIEGPGLEASLSYALCPGDTQDAGSLNSRGALVALVSDRVVVCRPDQLLVLEITTTADVAADALDAFDVVPVDVGDGYFSAVGTSSVSAFCCDPFGPIRLGSLVITANRYTSGRITAWDYDTLSPQWTVDIGDSSILLGSYDGLVMATPGGGRLVGIDTGTGKTRWELPLAPGEEVIGAAGEPGENTWYVSTQFPNTGEVASPRLRAVDVQSGELAWMTQMRPETVLQWVDPALFTDTIVVMDVPRIGADQRTSTTSHLIAYDRATGDQLWATDLKDSTEGFSDRLLAHDPERNLLFAATPGGEVFSIDPETGEILWRTQTGFFRIIGQDEEAVRLQRGSEQLELDLQTGEAIER